MVKPARSAALVPDAWSDAWSDEERKLMLIADYVDRILRVLGDFVEHDYFSAVGMANLVGGLEFGARALCDCQMPRDAAGYPGNFALTPELARMLRRVRSQTEAKAVKLLGCHAGTYSELLERIACRAATFSRDRLLPLLSEIVRAAGGLNAEAFEKREGRRAIHHELAALGRGVCDRLTAGTFDVAREQLQEIRESIPLEFDRLRTSQARAAAGGSTNGQTGVADADVQFKHSIDFSSVSWNGSVFTFAGNQKEAVRLLFEAHSNGTPEIHHQSIIAAIDSSADALRTVFKSGGKLHPAWNTLIVCGAKKGCYKLAIGETNVAGPGKTPG